MENYNEAMCHFYGYKLCWEKSFTEIFHLRASVSSKVWLFFLQLYTSSVRPCTNRPFLQNVWACTNTFSCPACAAWNDSLISGLPMLSPWCLTVDPQVHMVSAFAFTFLPLLPSCSLLVYLSLSLVVDPAAPATLSSLCHLCCPSSFFFSRVNLSPLLL